MNAINIAQVTIGRMKAALEDPVMTGFVERLEEINALADRSPVFIWRLQTSEGDATYLRPYDDDRILFNMSVWESIEQLKRYVYYTAHVEVLRQRQARVQKIFRGFNALWWNSQEHVTRIHRTAKP